MTAFPNGCNFRQYEFPDAIHTLFCCHRLLSWIVSEDVQRTQSHRSSLCESDGVSPRMLLTRMDQWLGTNSAAPLSSKTTSTGPTISVNFRTACCFNALIHFLHLICTENCTCHLVAKISATAFLVCSLVAVKPSISVEFVNQHGKTTFIHRVTINRICNEAVITSNNYTTVV